ncbi:MAG: hypothetical protein H6Q59_424 [Firmicutes bacterium]|nr:hypothetical protein [Bacillota bacterium]
MAKCISINTDEFCDYMDSEDTVQKSHYIMKML